MPRVAASAAANAAFFSPKPPIEGSLNPMMQMKAVPQPRAAYVLGVGFTHGIVPGPNVASFRWGPQTSKKNQQRV